MISFVYQHRVRYRECDPMGVAYHTHYLDYFEAARTETLRPLGISYKEIEASGVYMPVIDASIRYRKSIFYDDQIEIKVTIPEMPGFRFETVYEIRRKGESEILATGSVTLCFIDSVKRRPMKAPDFILDPIRGIWEEDNEVNL